MTEDCTRYANHGAVDTLKEIGFDNPTHFPASEVLTAYGLGNLGRPKSKCQFLSRV